MTASNHYLTGVAIAVAIPDHKIALPLAFISHFALDALPHFGDANFRSRLNIFKIVWLVDFSILVGLCVWVLSYFEPWYFIAGFLATSPDLVWIYRFFVLEKLLKRMPKNMNRFNNFHSKIQTMERPWGIYVELTYFAVMLLVMSVNIGSR